MTTSIRTDTEVRTLGDPPARSLAGIACVLVLAAVGALLFWAEVMAPWAVAGRSMEPALAPGDRVLVDRWTYRYRRPTPGEIALIVHPEGSAMVKRVVAPPWQPGKSPVPGRDERGTEGPVFWVRGDNAAHSADSRQFGPLPARAFIGRVCWRYWPLSRCGPIS